MGQPLTLTEKSISEFMHNDSDAGMHLLIMLMNTQNHLNDFRCQKFFRSFYIAKFLMTFFFIYVLSPSFNHHMMEIARNMMKNTNHS